MVSADAHNCVQCGSYISGRIRRGARTASFQSAAKDVYSQRYGLEKAYIGRNEGCYLEKFRAIRTNSTLISWNWCAFLFPPFWFLYRKMYQWAAVFGLAPLLLSLVLVEEVLLLVGFAAVFWPGCLPTFSISGRLKSMRESAVVCRSRYAICISPKTAVSTLSQQALPWPHIFFSSGMAAAWYSSVGGERQRRRTNLTIISVGKVGNIQPVWYNIRRADIILLYAPRMYI